MDLLAEPFETRYSRSRLRGLLVLPTVLAVVAALAGWVGLLPVVLAVVLVVLAAVVLLVQLLLTRAAGRAPFAFRIEDGGLVVPGCRVVRWDEVDSVEVRPLRPSGAIPPARLVAAVLPRPGVRLPRVHGERALPRWSAAFRQRTYGTDLVLPLFALDTEPDAVAAAFARRVPVRRPAVRRSPLGVVLLVVGGLVLLAVLGLVLLALLWMVV